ncbi:MAG TPA: SDR family NAD(P)-dependent oxidoreductase [Pyrinomonadaceae bacterium]|jgi:non-ribosomal peptide synthase protein (TIGR01720 family)
MDEKNTEVTGIAVVGMAGRFPKAASVEELWALLRDGVEAVSYFTDEELIEAGVNPAQLREPNYVKAKGVLEGVELFDAAFFGFSPREAEIMDPQQRVFLECAWEALESAGYGAERWRTSSVGLFGGVSLNSYLFNLFSNPGLIESIGFFHTMLVNDRDYLTTRVSYELNLKGPSLNVQTGCSTSLVAVHLACQSLLDYHCDMALAGGVSITVPKKAGYLYQPGGVASPDGHCRAFDASAQGTVNGNGVGVVVLKRVEDAVEDGDNILAVIRGSAINNDGSNKIGFTAPSVEGQAQVIAEAHAVAEVPADTISYVETHGTGTVLGDPIEIAALTKAFRSTTDRKNFCAITSTKTNLGHLDAAAGITGLIKTVLALRNRQLPPSLNFERPNPNIDFASSPFFVNTELRDWNTNGTPRRAGVSSFGIGGTNAHIILEEAPASDESGDASRPFQLLTLSAKTSAALGDAASNLAAHLRAHAEIKLADAAYTLQVGRSEFAYRAAFVCGDADEAVRMLEVFDAAQAARMERNKRRVLMMFPGQGAQYVGMGAQLYETEEVFRQHIDRCAELLVPHLKTDVRRLIFAGGEANEETSRQLSQTAITQPALFCIEYALAQLWMSWGVRPSTMIGHSIGEYVAACLAGVMSLEEALMLVATRGRLMQGLAPGSMLAVPLAEAEVVSLIEKKRGATLSLAAVNAPALCVVSGEAAEVDEVERELEERGVACRRLHTSHAFHSRMMEPILEEFRATVSRVRLRAPQLPFISNLSGRLITEAEATDPRYWVRHLREAVRFADGARELLSDPEAVLLEVGPGQTLSALLKQQGAEAPRFLFNSMRHPHERQHDTAFLLQKLGQLWLAGVEIEWPVLYAGERRRRVALPTYPFQRERFWIEAQHHTEAASGARQHRLGKRADIAEWFYAPAWKQSVAESALKAASKHEADTPRDCLLFADESGVGEQLSKRLAAHGRRVTKVRAGEQFKQIGDDEFTLAPGRREDYDSLLAALAASGKRTDTIVHLWNVTPEMDSPASEELFRQLQERGFYSLLFLAQALGAEFLSQSEQEQSDVRLCVVTSNLQAVTGEERLCPEKATTLGPCRVIGHEYPQIKCRSVDISLPSSGLKDGARVVEQLADELMSDSDDELVAYRGRHRWVQTFEEVRIESDGDFSPENPVGVALQNAGPLDPRPDGEETQARFAPRLRRRGVYLLTGGTGGIGFELADYLGRAVEARLILVGRSAFPERERWASWIEEHGEDDAVSRKIRRIQSLEEAGAEVLVAQANVADESEMRAVVEKTRARFGKIDGVIHAAGVPGGGVMQLQTPESIASVFEPKVNGTRVLASVLAGESPDFVALFSSHRSILGGLGRVDYCAANAYLDAFARAAGETNRDRLVCSIIWDGWLEVGMAVDAARRLNLKPEEAIESGMLTGEGIEAFRRVLGGALPEVVVSTQDFFAVVEESRNQTASGALRKLEDARQSQPKHARPNVQTPYVAPRNDAERAIAEIWQQLLGIEEVGIEDNFFELGGDSVLSIQIIARANKAGLKLTPQQIFHHQTIAELAAVATTAQVVTDEQEIVTGAVPLTPIQRWYFEQRQPDPHHFNQSLLLEARQPLDTSLLMRAVGHLLEHHDALRMRFVEEDSGWQQTNAAPGDAVPFEHVDLSALAESEQKSALEEAAAKAQTSLNLSEGPLMRVVLFDLGEGRTQRLLLLVHHLVMDAISWRILLEDLGSAYEQLGKGESVSLGAKTTSYKSWAERLEQQAQADGVRRDLAYWLADERKGVAPLPLDFEVDRQANTEESARTLQVVFDADETRDLLQHVPQAYHTQINDVLLAALALAVKRWSGQSSVLIDLEGHGRDGLLDDADVTRTVGWFTTIYPVLLKADGGEDLARTLVGVKEQLRTQPTPSVNYGLLRYMHADRQVGEQLAAMPQAGMSFLYLGQVDQGLPESTPFVGASESAGATISPRAIRSHPLTVNGLVAGGRLQLDWTYSENLHRRSSVERLAEAYRQSMRDLIAHCLNTTGDTFTPSDFPDAELSQDDLNDLMAEFSQMEE